MALNEFERETDFAHYIPLLEKAARKYCVIVASYDTPSGSPLFTSALAEQLRRALGVKQSLYDKLRCSYLAVVDKGRVITEGISNRTPLEWNGRLGKHNVNVYSMGFNMTKPNRVNITIDGVNHVRIARGVHFVIFDKLNDEILDYIAFDLWNQDVSFIPHMRGLRFYRKLFSEFAVANPDISFVQIPLNFFWWPQEGELTANECFISRNETIIDIKETTKNREVRKFYLKYPQYALNEYIDDPTHLDEVLDPPQSYLDTTGARRFDDYAGKYVNTFNGYRITTDQPETSSRTVWILGGCKAFSIGCRDVGTYASHLQRKLNAEAAEQGFRVNNCGAYINKALIVTHGYEADRQAYEIFAILNSLPIKSGDIVLLDIPIKLDFVCVEQPLFSEQHRYGEIFFDISHYTENGNRVIADCIYDTLKENDFFTAQHTTAQHCTAQRSVALNLSPEQRDLLEAYKSILSSFYQAHFGNAEQQPYIGSIVMNCNPFTLGHRYLIEQCAAKVDMLIVFVVQEDKSFFPIDDRIDLVDKGTADIPNVAVIKSGAFIISTLTFKEYFNKAAMQERIVDSSYDVTLFAQEIAPAAHIAVRFAGSEPFDKVTKQYNETMSIILPRYGIAFEEVPRIEMGEEAISASRVRKLLETHDWEKIAELVPPTTLEYLQAKF